MHGVRISVELCIIYIQKRDIHIYDFHRKSVTFVREMVHLVHFIYFFLHYRLPT